MKARVTVTLEERSQLQAEARGFSFLPKQPVHSLLSGRHASRLRGRGLAFEELRHYAQGDDVRTIDWRATARLRSPHVRVYSEERERPVLLLVDQRRPMFFGSRRTMKSVAAAESAALAAWRTLSVGDRIGGIVFNEEEIVDLRPQRNQTSVLRLLHELVRLNERLATTSPSKESSSRDVTVNNVLEAAVRRANHDHLVVIISDLDGANEETQRLATRLAAHNDVLMVAVYDPLGASLQNQPWMIAASSEGPIELPEGQSFRGAFREAFSERLDEWREIFQALQVPVIPVSTAVPPAEQLRELFGQKFSSMG
ncbi:MAG: DUF58 domain-containing protein [Verrucomicrobiota bacterium]